MKLGRGAGGAQDTVPLSVRMGAMMAVRAALTPLTYAVSALGGVTVTPASVRAAMIYLALTGALSCAALLPGRGRAVPAFGASLLVDGAYLQYQHEVIGHSTAVDIAIVTHLVVVCLLASFRSGLRMAIWQSILMVFALRAEQDGLFPMPGWAAGLNRERMLLADCALYWVAVIAASTTAAVNERELRRRRYDADSLRVLAEQLQSDRRPADVSARLCRFVGAELQATRVLVCARREHGWLVEASWGLRNGFPVQVDRRSPGLFSLPAGADNEVLSLTLDPAEDRWLDQLLPGARRVIALPLEAPDRTDHPGAGPARWLILEHGGHRGERVEGRLISTAAQAAATAAIASSRAELLQAAERAAATDGLTGLANRRTFDQRIQALMARCTSTGHPFSLIMVDVDRFKTINDTYGHQVGDLTLRIVARALADGVRHGGQVARYGGEEFAVLLPGLQPDEAAAIAERLRQAVHRVRHQVPVSASFGVAGAPVDSGSVEALIAMADAALIKAKQDGRDRVVRAHQRQSSDRGRP